jgi:UDP-2,3-diacylglucosamine pyrophosphatase LpxH
LTKLALIGDTHWGVRGDHPLFLNKNKEFFDNIVFPYIRENNIQHAVHLGDLLDRRKYTNNNTANRLRNDYINPLLELIPNYYQLVGNHDTFYKNTNELNSISEFYTEHPFLIIDNPVELKIDNEKILFLPWICDSNAEASFKLIRETGAKYALGHLEISGFEMYHGSLPSDGLDSGLFHKFSRVCSGHYHHRSSRDNISYLGSSSQFTWNDFGDEKGFHILDTDSNLLTFIENPYNVFKKIYYVGQNADSLIRSEYKDTYIKLIVKDRSNPYLLDKFVEDLEKCGTYDIQVIEDLTDLESDIVSTDIVAESESTLDICSKYIDSHTFDNIPKNKIIRKLTTLYNSVLVLEG